MNREKLIITPKPPKGEDGFSTFSIRIKTDLVDKIETIAALSGHSRNELIGILLDYSVNNCEVDSKPSKKCK